MKKEEIGLDGKEEGITENKNAVWKEKEEILKYLKKYKQLTKEDDRSNIKCEYFLKLQKVLLEIAKKYNRVFWIERIDNKVLLKWFDVNGIYWGYELFDFVKREFEI
jgi:septum formation topological specificity factor MinE